MRSVHVQAGFTLVELVVVVILLGVLAVVALPRFINTTEHAQLSAVKGVMDAFNSGVSFTQHRWRLDKSSKHSIPDMDFPVLLDATFVSVDPNNGLPVGSEGVDSINEITAVDCEEIMQQILTSNIRTVLIDGTASLPQIQQQDYAISVENSNPDRCHYYLAASLTSMPAGQPSNGIGFSYDTAQTMNQAVRLFDFR